ncbi:MAG: hypothetical protein ABI151_17075 [Chitinophagaceae bacterium]
MNLPLKFAPLLVILLISSCDFRKREEAIRMKEMQLNQKEDSLLAKERILLAMEEKMKKNKRSIDSVSVKDSSDYYNPALNGAWSAKMTCTETSCNESAIGDVRSEQWALSYTGYRLKALATVKNDFARAYIGTYFEHELRLAEDLPPGAQEQQTRMTVRLQLVDSVTMTGQREIVRENNCKVVYALQLKKIQ